MIDPAQFVSTLDKKGFRFFTGVPCSYFKNVIRCLEGHPSSSYYIAPNEGSALAAASGAYLGGEGAVVMIQNSGLGNLMNPLTSLSMIYHLPVLLFVSGRAYGIPDEPQHEIMGAKMDKILDSVGIRYYDLPQDDSYAAVLEQGIQDAKTSKMPVVFFVRQKTFGPYASEEKAAQNRFPLKRIDALEIIKGAIEVDDLVFAATGKISREYFAIGDRPGNFYMQGSMGHLSALAFGAAVAKPDRRVIVLDGDGAFLMHMGAASMVGHYKPANFFHIVLDNEAYETTGDQDTTSTTADFEQIAKACGYVQSFHAAAEKELKDALRVMLQIKGPSFLRVKINRLETKDIPRITTKYASPQITESVIQHCR